MNKQHENTQDGMKCKIEVTLKTLFMTNVMRIEAETFDCRMRNDVVVCISA